MVSRTKRHAVSSRGEKRTRRTYICLITQLSKTYVRTTFVIAATTQELVEEKLWTHRFDVEHGPELTQFLEAFNLYEASTPIALFVCLSCYLLLLVSLTRRSFLPVGKSPQGNLAMDAKNRLRLIFFKKKKKKARRLHGSPNKCLSAENVRNS